jgi:hypothetical protein
MIIHNMTIELLLTIISLIIALLALIVSFWYNKQFLEQSEKNTLAQITYESRKQSLFKLMKIIENKQNYNQFWTEVTRFLHSSDAIFIPSSVIQEIYRQNFKVCEFCEKNDPYPDQVPSDKEITKDDEEEYKIHGKMSQEEKFDHDYGEKITTAKCNMVGAITRELNFPISKKDKSSFKK